MDKYQEMKNVRRREKNWSYSLVWVGGEGDQRVYGEFMVEEEGFFLVLRVVCGYRCGCIFLGAGFEEFRCLFRKCVFGLF